MSVLHPSSIRPFLISRPRHHVFPNVSFSKHKTALLPNDGVLTTAGTFTECFEENFLPNGVSLPNSAHKSVSFLYQFLVLTNDFECFQPPATTIPRFFRSFGVLLLHSVPSFNRRYARPSIRVYATLSPLLPSASELAVATTQDAAVVLIWSKDLVVIRYSLRTLR
jgi:hypothetical protein